MMEFIARAFGIAFLFWVLLMLMSLMGAAGCSSVIQEMEDSINGKDPPR